VSPPVNDAIPSYGVSSKSRIGVAISEFIFGATLLSLIPYKRVAAFAAGKETFTAAIQQLKRLA
jgi:hypothetical protein